MALNSKAGYEQPIFDATGTDETLPGTPAPDTLLGGSGSDSLTGLGEDDWLFGDGVAPAPAAAVPGPPRAYWDFDTPVGGSFAEARGGPSATYYRVVDGAAVLEPAVPQEPAIAPNSDGGSAVRFNGQNSFAFIEHAFAMEVSQGTIALWAKPDDTEGYQTILAKDQSGHGTGAHFRILMEDDKLYLRMADSDYDGWHTREWSTADPVFTAGQWTHIAVSFTETGTTVFVNGVALGDDAWVKRSGDADSPGDVLDYHLLGNREPIVLGADTYRIEVNDTPADIAADGDLSKFFAGAVDGLGLWGGMDAEDALNADQVASLFAAGPGDVTAPAPSEAILAGEDTLEGGEGNDHLDGGAGDDTVLGEEGDDSLEGGYGDDSLSGGGDDDTLNGGRGSDLLEGGDGNDLLISDSDAGEQRIGQLVEGNPTREDPDMEVNYATLKLYGYEDQPLVADDILVGGAGADTFLFRPRINAKRDIILSHVQEDRTIRWQGVAGENNELHDHWVDSFGIDLIADYVASEDSIAVIGHTATIEDITYWDLDGDGDKESIITVTSNQGGGGGAHTRDLIGQIVVFGDKVTEDMIETDPGVFYGIVDTVDEIGEALAPGGDTKVGGYDTRDIAGDPVTGNPYDDIDNPFFASLTTADPTEPPMLNSKAGYEAPVFVMAGTDETLTGDGTDETLLGGDGNDSLQGLGGNDSLEGDGTPDPLPLSDPHVPLAYYGFDGDLTDARGGPEAGLYTIVESAALKVAPLPFETVAPASANTDGGSALRFAGEEESFAFIEHTKALEVSNGSIAFWVKPDEIDGWQALAAKDENGHGEGGHFRILMAEDHLYIRFADADYDGWENREWSTTDPVFTAGEWTHLAVSFTGEGITVYVDGVAIDDSQWNKHAGSYGTPGEVTDYHLLGNREPIVLGADTYYADQNDTPAELGTTYLKNFFTGEIDGLGLWGGMDAEDALNADQVASLFAAGPGDVTAPAPSEAILAGEDTLEGGEGDDTLDGGAGDDTVLGEEGDDSLEGGYGDDSLSGGADDDTLNGGRGSDLLEGGDGDDLLISDSDAGEQRIGQLVEGEPTRGDPDNEVNYATLKLYGYEDQPLVADDILVGGAGADTFLFRPRINAKRDIILSHVQDDRSIDWRRVAGENNELHDHWVDNFGIDLIADFVASEDSIAVIGHTARIEDITYWDLDGDGDKESLITVVSQQGGGGGAHTRDLLGQIVVFGDKVTEDMIETDPGVFYGIVDTVDEIGEALAPGGDTKVGGYDTRDIAGDPVTGNPYDDIDNPFFAGLTTADPIEPPMLNSKAGYEAPVFVMAGTDETLTGDGTDETLLGGDGNDSLQGLGGNDSLEGDGTPDPLPLSDPHAPVSYFGFDEDLTDARGGEDAGLYQIVESAALKVAPLPFEMVVPADANSDGGSALRFEGDLESFAFIEHSRAMEVSNGTIAVWVKPDETEGWQTIAAKDENGHGEGGHFRILMEDDKLYIRFADADYDGWQNREWSTTDPVFTAGEWTHLAVSFTGEGITVYVDGVALDDGAWQKRSGDADTPGEVGDYHLLGNREPIVLGADTFYAEENDTPSELGISYLKYFFTGEIDGFGIWGGMSPADALNADQIAALHSAGPGDLSAPSPSTAVLAGEDTLEGGDGDDTLDGGAGDDTVLGEDGNDSLEGGYGDDSLSGGAGSDTLNGGRGSDLLEGGDGNDLLISDSDAGEQRIGQLVEGEPTRGDPDNEVNYATLKLYGYENEPLIADDILIGGAGADTFLFRPLINAKRDIILSHVQDDRTIRWKGVAGENNELHDHWVDSFGIDLIADFVAAEDHIAVIGHTATIEDITYWDLDGDGDKESLITVVSQQGGGGGAHTRDLLGQIVVFGDKVTEDMIETNPGVTYGIVDTVDDIAEALAPGGDTKVGGYDTRDIAGDPVTGNPYDDIDNPFFAGLTTADPGAGMTPPDYPVVLPAAPGEPVAFWDFDGGAGGSYADTRSGLSARLYQVDESAAVPNTMPADVQGMTAEDSDKAVFFDGEYSFAFIDHNPAFAVANGTIALKINPTDTEGFQTFFAKDESGSGDGGHVRLAMDEGRLFIRLAEGDGWRNEEWVTTDPIFEAGEWTHVAVSFGEGGVSVYIDGVALGDGAFEKLYGDAPDLSTYTAAHLLNNAEPIVLGADTYATPQNDTPFEIATSYVKNFFRGTIDDFGIWGGPDASYALDAAAILDIIHNGATSTMQVLSGAGSETPVAGADPGVSSVTSAQEQLMLELVNRARLDPLGEADRLGIDLNEGLDPGTLNGDAKQPLAMNALLQDAAEGHSQWMLDTDIFSHTGSGGTDPGDRMASAGYSFTGSWAWGENISWRGTTGTPDLTSFIQAQHNSLFRSSGHRENILSDDFRELGIAQVEGEFTYTDDEGITRDYNASMVTQNFAKSGSDLFLTGVVYSDTDGNDFYSVGEGVGGTAINAVKSGGGSASASTASAGGYGAAVSNGVWTVTFGAGASAVAGILAVAGSNVKLDLVDGDTLQSSTDLTLGAGAMGGRLLGVADLDLTGNGLDNLLEGNSGDNLLMGLAGNDTLIGNAGADTLSGGADTDTADYSGSGSAVDVRLWSSGQGGDAQGDTYSSIERVIGSDHDDALRGLSHVGETLDGGAGNDLLQGGGGDDVLIGGAGMDTLGGAGGMDYADYSASDAGVEVRLWSTGLGGHAQGDVYSGIEGVMGSAFDDTLRGVNHRDETLDGGAGDDLLQGGAGDDVLIGGLGADTLGGGPGLDTADYSGSGSAVNVGLWTTGLDGDAQGDVYSGIERVVGSAHNDTLRGVNHRDETLDGAAGNDLLNGGGGDDMLLGGLGIDSLGGSGGNDTLVGGAGADLLAGGSGADIFDFDALNEAGDTITGFDGTTGDRLDVSDLLAALGYGGSDAVGDGYIGATSGGGTVTVTIDPDGNAGGQTSQTLASLTGGIFDLGTDLLV